MNDEKFDMLVDRIMRISFFGNFTKDNIKQTFENIEQFMNEDELANLLYEPESVYDQNSFEMQFWRYLKQPAAKKLRDLGLAEEVTESLLSNTELRFIAITDDASFNNYMVGVAFGKVMEVVPQDQPELYNIVEREGAVKFLNMTDEELKSTAMDLYNELVAGKSDLLATKLKSHGLTEEGIKLVLTYYPAESILEIEEANIDQYLNGIAKKRVADSYLQAYKDYADGLAERTVPAKLKATEVINMTDEEIATKIPELT